MRVVAILATHNEERFIAACLDHLIAQQVEVYLIDNGSVDRTVEIAKSYLGRGLLGIDHVPHDGQYHWRPLLEHKERLAGSIEADWFMHADADEIRMAPRPGISLRNALVEVDALGYNAVNFLEFTFVPTLEQPDHDHDHFLDTLRSYYPFVPAAFPNRLNAWKRQPARVELAWSGGHVVRFDGLRIYPHSFLMRHYLFLSVPHAIRKYVERRYSADEVAAGWHLARVGMREDAIVLPAAHQLHRYVEGRPLDIAAPLDTHPVFARLAAHAAQGAA